MTYTPGLMQYSPSHAFSQVCAATLGAGEPRPPREGRGGRPEAGGGEGEGGEINSAAGYIDHTIVESTAETTVLILSARRSSCSER